MYLANVPVILDRFEAAVKLPEAVQESHFSELETGMFNESNLWDFASEIGNEWEELGCCLGINQPTRDHIKHDNPYQMKKQIVAMLHEWSEKSTQNAERETEFVNALKAVGRVDIAEKVKKMIMKSGKV